MQQAALRCSFFACPPRGGLGALATAPKNTSHLQRRRVELVLTFALAAGCASPQSSSTTKPDEPPPSAAAPARPPRRPGIGPAGGGGAGQRALEQAMKLAESGDLDGAIKESKAAIAENPNLEKAYLLLGSACAMRDDAECEASAYEAGVAALPRSAALLNERGLLRLRREDKKGAIEDLESAISLSRSKEAKFMADLAYAYIFVDRVKEGEALAEKARRVDPKCVEAAMAHGEVLLHEKKGKQAAEAFRAAEAIAPPDAEVKSRLRRQLAVSLSIDDQHDEALAIYQSLAKDGGGRDPLLEVQIAGELMKLDRAKEAVRHMEKAVEMSPKDPRFLSLLLQTQQKAGDKKGAKLTQKRLDALGAR